MRALVLLLAACLCSGCFVFDEIDAGQKEMDRYGGKTPAKQEAATAAKQEPQVSPKEQARQWWDKARSITPGEDTSGSSGIVKCRLDGALRFMSETDCSNSGGRVEKS
jgi:hypothetical protein